MHKVSIIIPIYNVEMYLEQCLESVIRQTLKDIEIICVNDGSTDSSLQIIEVFAKKDERIKIISGPNGGYGCAMNKGLDMASGEYIGIVEPDDFVPLSMYEDLYTVAKENDLDLVKADFFRFKTEKNGDMMLSYNHLDKTDNYYNQVIDPSNTPQLTKLIMNTWSGIYKRDFIEQYHIRHHETPGASFQDNGFFWQTFIYAKRAMFINKPYYMNRRDNPNSSVNNPQKVYCMNIEYDHIRDILMEDISIWNKFKGYYNLKRFHNYMFTLERISNEFKKEYVKRISLEFKKALEQKEIEEDVFEETGERSKLMFLINDPDGFNLRYGIGNNTAALTKKLNNAERRIKELENSTTFKVGKIVMYIPIKIKKALLGL